MRSSSSESEQDPDYKPPSTLRSSADSGQPPACDAVASPIIMRGTGLPERFLPGWRPATKTPVGTAGPSESQEHTKMRSESLLGWSPAGDLEPTASQPRAAQPQDLLKAPRSSLPAARSRHPVLATETVASHEASMLEPGAGLCPPISLEALDCMPRAAGGSGRMIRMPVQRRQPQSDPSSEKAIVPSGNNEPCTKNVAVPSMLRNGQVEVNARADMCIASASADQTMEALEQRVCNAKAAHKAALLTILSDMDAEVQQVLQEQAQQLARAQRLRFLLESYEDVSPIAAS